MIEKIYFRVLTKMYPNKDTEGILKILGNMTNDSFKAQEKRLYKGNLAKNESILTKEYAEKLSKTDRKQTNIEMEKAL